MTPTEGRAYVDPTAEALSALAALPGDGQVVTLNLLRYRDEAEYPEGPGYEPCSGREAYARYGAVALPRVSAAGGRVELGAEALLSVIGPPGEWDEVLLVRYPSRAAFLGMLADPDYRASTVHRTAAHADSRLIALRV